MRSPADSARARRRLRSWAALAPAVGGPLLVLSFHHAAQQTGPADQLQFALYWAGFLIGMLPLVALACAREQEETTRYLALLGISLFGALPKVLRDPSGPLFSDEFAHQRQVIETFRQGDVGHTSTMVSIAQQFPGLHQAISAVAQLTGLSLWTVSLAVVIAAHTLSTLGIARLIRALGGSQAGAMTGAVVFTLNPSWVFFDTQVAYESLALPLAIWCLAEAVAACQAGERDQRDGPAPLDRPMGERWRHAGGAVLAGAATVVTHHLAAIVLCALLLALCGAASWRARRVRVAAHDDAPRTGPDGWPVEHKTPLLVATAAILAIAIAWWTPRFHQLVGYLSPSVTRGVGQAAVALGVGGSRAQTHGGTRTPFTGSEVPRYELLSSLAFPAIVLILMIVATWVLWRERRRLGSAMAVFGLLAAMFFASLPMLLTAGGSEGAHRSWAYSFIGVAVRCGMARSLSLRAGAARTARTGQVSGVGRRTSVALVALLTFSLLAVGGTAAGQNVAYRFPGQARAGDDTRSVSQADTAVAGWLAAHAPADTPVLADRYVSHLVGSVGRMATLAPSPGFPMWQFYQDPNPVPRTVVRQLAVAQVRYLVVDSRMATVRPGLGFWFTTDEPGSHGDALYPAAALARFDCLPWLSGVFAAGTLTVYEVNQAALGRTLAGACPAVAG